MQGKIFVKQSLSDAYRQYLEDVTIPMNTYLDAPEEFVTTKPSIYHSLRMQPATDARTGRVRNSPAKARALSNMENLNFQNDLRDFSLPLHTNQGEPLYGRHVYPGELFSFNPSIEESALPDLPRTYMRSHGGGDLYRPLNLYGFTGDAFTPQRFTNRTLQPEGIIYGNLDENDVVQLNTRPATAPRFSQVARALSPFHSSKDVGDLGVHSEELARNIMDAGIPPILAESNVDTRGRTHHLPFRLDEVVDVTEAHDPFAQYDMGNLNRPSPQGLEQFTLDSIRASEPMDIAMQLLKMPQEAKDYANQIHEGQMYGEQPYMNHVEDVASGFDDPHLQRIAYLHDTIEDSETGIGEIHERFGEDVGHAVDALTRRQGEQYFDYINRVKEHPEATQIKLADLHSNLKNNPNESLAKRYQKAIGILTNKSEPMDIAFQLLKEEVPYGSRDYPPQEISISTGTPLMGSKNSGPTPEVCNMPGCESGLPPVVYRRMANPIRSIDNHEFMCEQCAYKHDLQSLLFDKMIKGEITPMEYAMRLLKRELHPGRDIEGYLNDDGHYVGEEELYNLNDPEVQDFVNRLHLDKQPPEHLIPETLGMDLGYVEPELRVENRDTKLYHPMMMDEHENLDKFPDRKIVEREDGTEEELVSTSDPTSDVVGVGRTGRTLVSPKPTFQDIPFSEETGFTLSEPMEIAMQLLKERVSPEAKRHKLEYDKKYESSPERIKYREELNRERRRRHIMGQGGPDMSHTKDHNIVPESPHTNRARHFKDKGTLL